MARSIRDAPVRTFSGVRSKLTALVVGALLCSSFVAVGSSTALALSGDEFMPGYIISDSLFYNSSAMSEAEIQLFLESKGSGLAGYTFTVASRPRVVSDSTGNVRCEAFQGGTLSSAAIIYRAQAACGISAKVLLVTLQKEQGLITKSAPSQGAMDRAMGFACPDTAPCAPTTLGFGNQVYSGALQLNTYKASRFGRQPGPQSILFNPNSGCGATQVNVQNYATAALYNYTPYQPNAAALANLHGTGDSCSSYGNRNFWVFYQSWFGSTLGNTPYPVGGAGILGSTAVGATLTVQPGTWSGSPAFSYAWLRCDSYPTSFDGVPVGCSTLAGETTDSYISKAGDVGKFIAAIVTGSNSYGELSTGAVLDGRVGSPANVVPPVLSGGAPVGSTWTVDVGTWVGSPTPTIAIYWLRCNQPVSVTYSLVPAGCAVIDGEHGTAYVSKAADVGKYLTAQVAGNSSLGFSIVGTTNTTPTQ